MHKKIIISFVAFNIVAISAAGYYLLDTQKKAIHTNIEQEIIRLNKEHNNRFTLSHNASLSNSSGLMIYQNSFAPHENFTISYNIKHHLSSLISGEYIIDGEVTPSEQMRKSLKTNGPLFNLKGVIFKNGTLDIDYSNPSLTLVDNATSIDLAILENVNGKLKKESNLVTISFNVGATELLATDVFPNTKISNITSSFSFVPSDKNIYKFNFNVASANSQFFRVKNLFAEIDLSKNDTTYDFISKLGVENIDTPFYQGIYASINYGFSGLTEKSMNELWEIYEANKEYFHSSSQDIPANQELEDLFSEKFLNSLKEGLSFSIYDLTIGDKKDKLTLAFNFSSPQSNDGSDYYFEKNASVQMKADLSGQYVPLIRMFSLGSLSEEEINLVFTSSEVLKLDFSYKDQKSFINSTPTESDFFPTVLRDVDKEFKLPNPNIIEDELLELSEDLYSDENLDKLFQEELAPTQPQIVY